MEVILKRIIYILIMCLFVTALMAEEEIVSRRTFFSKTYDVENNQYRTRLHSSPIHYLNENNSLIDIDFNDENCDSLVALAWRQSLGRDYEYFNPYDCDQDNGSIQAGYYTCNDLSDWCHKYSNGYFGLIQNSDYWDVELTDPNYQVHYVIEREYNQYHLWDDTLFNYDGCSILFYNTCLNITMSQATPVGHLTYERLENNNMFDMPPVFAFENVIGYGDTLFVTDGINVEFGPSFDSNDTFTLDFVQDVIQDSNFFNISIVNDQAGTGLENEPNYCETSIDIYYNVYFSVSGTVSNLPLDNLPIIHLESGNWYDTEIVSEDSTYFFDNIPYISGGRDIHIFLTDPDYPYLYTYEDQNYYDVTTTLTDCNFEAIDPVSISGSFTNYSSTPIEDLDIGFYDEEDIQLNETSVTSTNTYEILVPSGCSGSLIPDASTFNVYPEERTYADLTSSITGENFEAYLESQISQISGTVTLTNGNGNVTDVILNIADNDGPVVTCNIDDSGNYEFELTPVNYDGNPEFHLNFELMPLNGEDSDYYKVRRELTIDNGDDHLIDVTMKEIDLNNIIVDSDIMVNGFHDFISAMDYVQDINQAILPDPISSKIIMLSDTYADEMGIHGLQSADLEIIGIGDCVINGQGVLEHGIAFYDCDDVSLTLDNLEICNWVEGGIVESSTELTDCYLTIQNCYIHDNIRTTPVRGENGGGIAIFHPSTIINNQITNNQAPIAGGGIYISSTAGTSIIEDNEIEGNISDIGGGIYLQAQTGNEDYVDYTIEGNTITGNELNSDTASSPLAAAVFVQNSANISFKHNIITETPGLGDMTIACAFQHVNDLFCHNNTFTDNTTVAASYWDFTYLDFRNNIISDNIFNYSEPYPIRINDGASDPYLVRYNCLYGNTSNEFNSTITVSNTVTEDPHLNTQFYPEWNASVKSSCIDTGHPNPDSDSDEWFFDPDDQDPDGSRQDIGAKTAVEHCNSIATLQENLAYNWISIPGIDNFAESTRTNDIVSYVFDEYEDNGLFDVSPEYYILNNLEWKYNGEYGRFYWENGHFNPVPANVMDLDVRSQKGYKIQMSENADFYHFIEYSGFLPGTSGNPEDNIHIELPVQGEINCTLNEIIDDYEREIWLGYFLEGSLHPMEALEPILENLIMIKARDWALARLPVAGTGSGYTDNWISCAEYPDLAINFGEMVSVIYIGDDDVDFEWGGDDPEPPYVDYYKRDLAEYFEYEDQEDYIPIFVEIDLDCYEEGEKPIEIAIFVEEICKGATVIKESQVQLNAYILNDPTIELKDLEFQLWFPQRNGAMPVEQYAYRDNKTGYFKTEKAIVADCGDFLKVSLRDKDIENGNLPEATCLKGNSPNPFNPETKIEFELANNSLVKLDVFNIKGQHIRSLIKGSLPAARHEVIWNGENNSGQEVSSGVYFYVLQADGLTLSHKMLLLK